VNTLRIIEQIKKDEGFSPKAYFDNDQYTNGFGTKAKYSTEEIDKQEAEIRLGVRVQEAINDFKVLFGGKEIDEVRAEALVNMLFNLGRTKLSHFKKLLGAIYREEWGTAAHEAFNSAWFKQLSKPGLKSIERAERIVWELLTGTKG